MKQIIQNPLFSPLIAYIVGIIFVSQLNLPILWGGIPAGILIGWRLVVRKNPFLKDQANFGLLLMFFCLLGGIHVWLQSPDSDVPGLEPDKLQTGIYAGIVCKNPKATPYGRYTWLDLESFQNEETGRRMEEKVVIYLQPKDSLPFQKGDTLILLGTPKPASSKNQGYLDFLASVGISYTINAKEILLHPCQETGLTAWISGYRNRFANELADRMQVDQHASIAKAMFLGDKSALSSTTKEVFATAGLSHILAVSGLHVGVIYLGLGMFLMPLLRIRHGAGIRQILLLVGLLGYMFLAGAGPAVVRAVLMFGLMILIRLFGKKAHLLTALSFSAWIQILLDPLVIMQVGFQLSYTAVLGIFWILPWIERQFSPGAPVWLRHLNSGMAVTIAASVMTAPLVWWYFGAFPAWFLISNILISFLAFPMILIGFGSVVLIALFPNLGLTSIFVDGSELIIGILLSWAQMITELPFARMETGGLLPEHGWIIGSQLIVAFSFFTWKQIRMRWSILVRSTAVITHSIRFSR